MEKETRSFEFKEGIEIATDSRNVNGYAATYSEYDMGEFIERIDPKAFENLAGQDIRALYNHDANHVLARWNKGQGTLNVTADARGLAYSFELPNTGLGNDIKEQLKRGDINQSSWSFTIKKDEWNTRGEKPVRTITEVGKIYDVSLVTFPANPDTSVALRSLQEAQKQVITEKPIKMETPVTAAPAAEETRAANFVDSSVVARGFSKAEKRDFSKFNPMKIVKELAQGGRLTGFEAELNQEGIKEARQYAGGEKEGLAFHVPVGIQKEARAQLVGTSANGGILVADEFKNFINFLWPNTPTTSLCSVYDNLEGTVSFPTELVQPSLGWGTETGASTAQTATFGQVESSPTRAHMTMEMSRRVLIQEHSNGLQSRLVNQMNNAFNSGLEAAILNGSGASNEPEGIITALAASLQVVGVPTFKKLVDNFELILANNDALKGRLAYVTDPATLAFLKTTLLDAGSGKFLAEGSLQNTLMANGYPVATTTVLPLFTAKHAMIFGNFEDVAINFWGGPVLMVNPYTKMKESLIELYFERQMDVKVLRADSFAVSKDIVYS